MSCLQTSSAVDASLRVWQFRLLAWLKFLTCAAMLSLPSVDRPLLAQGSYVPAEIYESDTTLVARVAPSVAETLVQKLFKRTPNFKKTVLGGKIQKTNEIFEGENVWVTTNWPAIPTKIKLFVVGGVEGRIEELSEVWGFEDGQLSKTSRPGQYVLFSLSNLKPPQTKPETNDDSVSPLQSPKKVTTLRSWKDAFTLGEKNDANGSPIRIVIMPPKHFYQVLNDMLDRLPNYLGGGPVSTLTEGFQYAAIDINPEDLSVDGYIQSQNNEAASQLKTELFKLHDSESASIRKAQIAKLVTWYSDTKTPEEDVLVEALESAVLGIKFEVQQDRVKFKTRPSSIDALAAQTVKTAIGRVTIANQNERLRQLTLAIHKYESDHRSFPSAIVQMTPDQKPGLSWRVHILPFLGDKEFVLWKKFKLDEPWNSTANIKLLPEMPTIYGRFQLELAAPENASKGLTTVQAPVSEKTILGFDGEVKFQNVTDGTSNTILLVTVKDSLAVPWTAPQDYTFDAADPGAGLQFFDGKTPVALCDSSTRGAVKENSWRELFEMNDGSPVQLK